MLIDTDKRLELLDKEIYGSLTFEDNWKPTLGFHAHVTWEMSYSRPSLLSGLNWFDQDRFL